MLETGKTLLTFHLKCHLFHQATVALEIEALMKFTHSAHKHGFTVLSKERQQT
jgi:hypothetical protein